MGSRKSLSLAATLLAVAFAASSASGSLVVTVSPDPDSPFVFGGNVVLPVNSSITLFISLRFNPDFPGQTQSYQGGDFRINTGGGSPESGDPSFGNRAILLPPGPDTVGNWLFYPPGDNRAYFTGGPSDWTFGADPPNSGLVLNVASIELRSGDNEGEFTGYIDQNLQLNGNYQVIPNVSSTPFHYIVGVVPEPSSALLLSLAVTVMTGYRRRSS